MLTPHQPPVKALMVAVHRMERLNDALEVLTEAGAVLFQAEEIEAATAVSRAVDELRSIFEEQEKAARSVTRPQLKVIRGGGECA